ncbi:MAG: 50S ribosomal protein L10 [Actinomycetota bacterium]
MAKPEKIEKVAVLKERIEGADALLLTDYRGLTVGDTKELREGLSEANASFAVVKNSLFKRAVDEAGLEVLDVLLTGPTAAVFIKGDAVLAAKRVAEASKKFESLQIKGGFMDGKLLSAEEAAALAKLRSREEMLSQLAGMMQADMTRAASIFQALQGKFLGLLEAYKEKLHETTGGASEASADDGEKEE